MKRIAIMTYILILTVMSFPMISKASGNYFADDYMYTIRVYTGGQGTFADGTTEMTIKAAQGTVIDLTEALNGIAMKPATDLAGNAVDNKYYPKGIRESGKDNNTVNTIIGPVFQVTRDMDYVVAYAMKGGDVAYTIKYVKKDDQESLLPDEIFYGNVGDKPVIAYKHIDGYVPQAYSLAKTLQEDETQNVFTFYYVPGKEDIYYYTEKDGGVIYTDEIVGETFYDYIPGETVYVHGGGGVRVIQAENPGRNHTGNRHNTQKQNQADANNQQEQNAEDGVEQEPNFEEAADAPKMDTQPEVLIDLDDEPIPLSDGTQNSLLPEKPRSIESAKLIKIMIIIVILIAIIVTIALLFVRKKLKSKLKKKQSIEETEEASEKIMSQIMESINGENDER